MPIWDKIKRTTWLIAFLWMGCHCLHGQSWLIQGTIENAEAGPVLLASFHDDRFRVVDSMETTTGFFYFMLPGDATPGLYRIIYADRIGEVRMQNRFVEFIFNGENLEIFVASTELGPVPYFENSLENLTYKEFMGFELDYEAELMTLYGQLYPSGPGTEDRDSVVERYNELQRERSAYMDSLTHLYPDFYAVRIMNAFRSPHVPGEMSHLQRIDTLKQCFFDHAAIDDPALLSAPVYTYKLIDYLSLYKDRNLDMDQQEEQFMEAVDQIMVNVSRDQELRAFVVEFLLEGFELLGMEKVQMHLADHYLDEACESDIVDLVLSRMEGYKKMTPGEQAPDFVLRDVDGMIHRLSRMDNPWVLVMFWSSTCEGCRRLMPELHDWYLTENTLDLEVVAISIDTSAANFEYMYELLAPQWITAHDPLGWYGKIPSDYKVYATPSLFLLDRQRSIVAKPMSFRQFLRTVKKLDSLSPPVSD
ncbi:MAG: AhpC/TSA family protein [Bacteroidia bacterium]|nr:MAG: AhpC/TSA family protein [Bacteroidia bacterium]